MKTTPIERGWGWALAALGLSLRAAALEVTVESRQCEVGQQAHVALRLAGASRVAAVDVQLNYDAQVLSVAGVTNAPGSAGAAFALDWEAGDGTVIVRLYRADELSVSNGVLADVVFQLRPGVRPGTGSNVAVARTTLADAYGADLAWRQSIQRAGGEIWCVYSGSTDSDGDGLSDYEEQMLDGSPEYAPGVTDTAVDRADTDGDGMPDGWEVRRHTLALANDADEDPDHDGLRNLDEFRFGSDPQAADSDHDGASDRQEWLAGTGPNDPRQRFMIEGLSARGGTHGQAVVFAWGTGTGRLYTVMTRTGLTAASWAPVADSRFQRMAGTGGLLAYTNPPTTGGARCFTVLAAPR